jgi:hypothetical protein
MKVCIVTRVNDFHAFAIADRLHDDGITAVIVESDALSGRAGMTWQPGPQGGTFTLNDRTGMPVALDTVGLVWWRRLTGTPQIPGGIVDPAALDLIARDCRTTLAGGFATGFRGRFISDPERTRAAENKLVQLQAACEIGLRLPETLVSQDPVAIQGFCDRMGGKVIVKPVAGTPLTPLLTGRPDSAMLQDGDALSLSPAIYQRLIEGDSHLRVCVFGDDILAARLVSDRLDWRYPLDAACSAVSIPPALGAKLCALLDRLGLRMGVFDLKEQPDGEPVFLEVNPQGQFLFLEGLCGLPLTDRFATFVKRELATLRQGQS